MVFIYNNINRVKKNDISRPINIKFDKREMKLPLTTYAICSQIFLIFEVYFLMKTAYPILQKLTHPTATIIVLAYWMKLPLYYILHWIVYFEGLFLFDLSLIMNYKATIV